MFNRDPGSVVRRQVLGALCWLAGVEFFVAEAVARSAAIGYSAVYQDISLLGLTACGPYRLPVVKLTFDVCSPLHDVLNGGLVLLGALWIVGAWLTRDFWPATRLARASLVMIGIGGIGMALCGVFALDGNAPIHIAGAILHFVVGAPGIVLLGLSQRNLRPGMALFSVLLGSLGFLAFLLYGGEVYLGLGRGGMERLAAYSTTLWMIATGAVVLRRCWTQR